MKKIKSFFKRLFSRSVNGFRIGDSVKCNTSAFDDASKDELSLCPNGMPKREGIYTIRDFSNTGGFLFEEIINPKSETCDNAEPSFRHKHFVKNK